MKYASLILFILCTCIVTKGEQVDSIAYPEVGKVCPDFVLKNIEYYSKREVTLKDFNGKWLVLDFWGVHCSSCIAGFPKINALQKKFDDKVQFILVGHQDAENEIRPTYAKFRERENLNLPCAFDSVICNRFDRYTGIIVIDPNGIVQAIADNLTSDNITDFLAGNHPLLERSYRMNELQFVKYDRQIPFLINGNGGNDTNFLYRSLLSKWTNSICTYPSDIFPLENGRFEALSVNASILYMYAYSGKCGIEPGDSLYGKVWHMPFLEIRDSSLFQFSRTFAKNLFSYSLTVPPLKATKEYLMEVMQRDLKNYFGYDISIEIRKMPCWKLVATKDAKKGLKTKMISEKPILSNRIGRWSGFTAKNYPISKLILCIERMTTNSRFPIIDETEIDGNIDINLDVVTFDLAQDDIWKSLRTNGLDLIKGERDMKVIVIRDENSKK